jgi:hypothetical protein
MTPAPACLTLAALVQLLWAAPAVHGQPVRPVPTVLGEPVVQATGEVAVPFEGPVPRLRRVVINDRRWYYDLEEATTTREVFPELVDGRGGKVRVARRPGGRTARIAVTLPAAGSPSLTFDWTRHLIRVQPAAVYGYLPVRRRTAPPFMEVRIPPPAARPPVPGAVSWLERVGFDARRDMFVLPYRGAPPVFTINRRSERAFDVVCAGCAAPPGALAGDLPWSWLVRRWLVDRAAPPTVTLLSVELTAPGDVVAKVDAARHQLLVIPQLAGRTEAKPVASLKLRTVLGGATFQREHDWLVLPYYGSAPIFAVNQVARDTLYVDFGNAGLFPAGVQVEQVNNYPLLSQWVLAPRPLKPDTRLALKLPFGGHVRVLDDAAARRLYVKIVLEDEAPAGLPGP